MKKKMLYIAFVAMIVAVSVVYARSGRSNVFTFAVHPLAAYADQLPSEPAAPEAAPLDLGAEGSSLLDDPTK